MVYNPVEYVRYTTYGNTARKIVQTPVAPKVVLPKLIKQKRKVIYVDPISLLSIAVALCMVLTMTIGIIQFAAVRNEAVQMEAYVSQLSSRNAELTEEYQSGYDIEQIEQSARALGMVSRDEVQTVAIQVSVPQVEETVTLWDRFGTFLTSFFA